MSASDTGKLSIPERVAHARQQFQELSGLAPEAVSSVGQAEGGLQIELDVVEVRRVPDTADLMATYRVTTDENGDVAGYERVRRFSRSEADRPAS